jgi:aryl-alcohol dehydrogenase-like predicted oxidoreductase
MVEGAPRMKYRKLGNTGLRVSVLGYGNWLNSDSEEAYINTRDCIKACVEGGVNFFDTAEVYGQGEAEKQMGRAFKELGLRRESLVVSTKLIMCGDGINDKGLSRKHLMEGIANSLKRLQMDYVDVLFCHRPDLDTPLEETCRAMHDIINSNRAFYWGTSEWPV